MENQTARHLIIDSRDYSLRVILDGVEIKGVVGYELAEAPRTSPRLKLDIPITEDLHVEVLR